MSFRKSGEERQLKDNYVFDTGPLYLYFTDDARATEPMRAVSRNLAKGYTCEPNLLELYYKTCEKLGRDAAMIRYVALRHSTLTIARPDDLLTRTAGELKCSHRNQLSLADAYIVALAKQVHGKLYTTDTRIAGLQIVPTQLLEI